MTEPKKTTHQDIINQLKEPFDFIHFRPKTCYEKKILLLAYIDSRDVMKRLDDVFGLNWQCEFKEVKGNVYCGIGVRIEKRWIWRWDCGSESNMEKEKGESSDAFKRAAVKFGIGRYLYYLKRLYVEIKQQGSNYIKIKDNGTGQQVTGYYDDPDLPKWALPKNEDNG
jgi:hypothetical protein